MAASVLRRGPCRTHGRRRAGRGTPRRRLRPARVIVCDTGPIVAAALVDDAHHHKCVELFTGLHLAGRPILVPGTVVAEVGYLLARNAGPRVEALFLDAIAEGDSSWSILSPPMCGGRPHSCGPTPICPWARLTRPSWRSRSGWALSRLPRSTAATSRWSVLRTPMCSRSCRDRLTESR